jgi:hypothetical protein
MKRSLALLLLIAGCAAPQPPPVAPPPPPPPGLDRLIGKPAANVTALLGPASLDKTEGPARLMQFVRPLCVLDVFLYPPVTGGAPLVRTAAARKPDGARMDPGSCLGLIVPVAG